MEFKKIEPLLQTQLAAVFNNNDNLYREIKAIADLIVLDESGFDINLIEDVSSFIEPYAYIVSKLSVKKLSNISEEMRKNIESDFKRAVEILRSRKTTELTAKLTSKLTTGLVGGIVW